MAKKDFYIPQIEGEEIKLEKNDNENETNKKYQSEGFISSIYGKNTKDNSYYHGVQYGNNGRQYDSFREKTQRSTPDDFKDYLIPKDIMGQTPTSAPSKPEYYEREQTNEEVLKVEKISIEEDNNDGNAGYDEPEEYVEEEYVSPEPKKPVVTEYTKPYQSVPKPQQHEPVMEEEKTKKATVHKLHNNKKGRYVAPPLSILRRKPKGQDEDLSSTQKQRDIIDQTLREFDIAGRVVNFTKGPTVTQFEIALDPGVNLRKVSGISINLQANLEATSIRIQAPIPGKSTIGLEAPNVKREIVYFGDMLAIPNFLNDNNPMNVVLGMNISGKPVYLNLASMPHGLVAGSTGSGKSVCINAVICSLLYKAHPDDVKLIMIDPKRVEFARYGGIPHLATPIISEPKLANAALKWAVDEMENRYLLFEATGVSKYTEYVECSQEDARLKHIPYIVIIIDELADLIISSGSEVEESIMRLTQKARAAGIHLIVATQRPSADIIKGTIKTNITTRIAFKVNQQVDSQIILDHGGAEKLLGLGDMLYNDEAGVENRIQGAFVSTPEMKEIVKSISDYTVDEYLFTEDDLKKRTLNEGSDSAIDDELFYEIARYVVTNNTASINSLQRIYGCGFPRIQNIIIKLGELGVVSENLGSRAREVLVNPTQLEDILDNL